MSTPSNYYSVFLELEAVKAMAFELLMSDEISSIDGPKAKQLSDFVFDTDAASAKKAIRVFLGENND